MRPSVRELIMLRQRQRVQRWAGRGPAGLEPSGLYGPGTAVIPQSVSQCSILQSSPVLILQACHTAVQPAQWSQSSSELQPQQSLLTPSTIPPFLQAGSCEGQNNKHKESHQAQTNFLITKPSRPPTSRLYWRGDYAIYLYANESQHWIADIPSQINLIFSHPLLLAIFNRIIVLLLQLLLSFQCQCPGGGIQYGLIGPN